MLWLDELGVLDEIMFTHCADAELVDVIADGDSAQEETHTHFYLEVVLGFADEVALQNLFLVVFEKGGD